MCYFLGRFVCKLYMQPTLFAYLKTVKVEIEEQCLSNYYNCTIFTLKSISSKSGDQPKGSNLNKELTNIPTKLLSDALRQAK